MNGLVTRQAPYTCGTTISYSCNFGFQVQGQNSLTCGENGLWNGNPPFCSPAGESNYVICQERRSNIHFLHMVYFTHLLQCSRFYIHSKILHMISIYVSDTLKLCLHGLTYGDLEGSVEQVWEKCDHKSEPDRG